MRGDDEQDPSDRERDPGDDRPCPGELQLRQLRRCEPDSREENEQESDFREADARLPREADNRVHVRILPRHVAVCASRRKQPVANYTRCMVRLRLAGAVGGLVVLCCIASGCGSSNQATTSASAPRTWSVVALGDSVPRGTNCDCRPYPELSADELATSSSQTVTATNDAVAGATTAHVLEQLKSDSDVIGDVRSADVVEIEIGANDVGYSASCGTSVECYAPRVPAIEKNLRQIVGRTRELTSGHKALVVLLDYWSVWLGGKYAAAKGDAYVAAAEEMTDRVDAVINQTATATGSAYVDLRAAFKGPSYTFDETHYLSNDGDHPNAAGHQKISEAAVAVIEKTLHL